MPTSYRYKDKKRKNLPAAGMAVKDQDVETEKLEFSYDPHLTPVLRFDESGETDKLTARVEKLLEKAKTEALSEKEIQLLQKALLRSRQPWLEWSTKREKKSFHVDPVALHIHEKVSARAILKAAERDDLETDLFQNKQLDREAEKQFYQHDVDWANRLILGDSLQVMTSLAQREGLAGKVQMIYIDPPYGIKFSSNWQNEVGKRDVKDSDADLSREPEMIRAYRDTWTLGVHSYLDYLKQRLIAAHQLLTDSGSVFVQISDENLHRVRSLCEDVFGQSNFISLISVAKTSSATSGFLPSTTDYIVWFAKDRSEMKFNRLYVAKDPLDPSSGAGEYKNALYRDGSCGSLKITDLLPEFAKRFRPDNVISQSGSKTTQIPFEFQGKIYRPSTGGWKTNSDGLSKLKLAERLMARKTMFSYVRYLDDFPVLPVSDVWGDVRWGFDATEKRYVVETNSRVVQRCVLMATEPGDIVLDPTCGSGTTAFVSEQWGRRWITIDSSRVAVSIAKQRLVTAKLEAFKTNDESEGIEPLQPKNPGTGFTYKSVPHITLKSIAQNASLDPIFEKHEPILAEKLDELNAALKTFATDELKAKLVDKLVDFHKREGTSEVTDALMRRWLLPGCDASVIKPFSAKAADKKAGFSKNITKKQTENYVAFVDELDADAGWKEWQVPFDVDEEDWPAELQEALRAYREAWRAKMDEVNACIEANAEQEELVDQPEIVKGVTRVSGPFTVESVRPLEKSLKGDASDDSDSPIGGEPEEMESFDEDDMPAIVAEPKDGEEVDVKVANAMGHMDRMLALMRVDGLTFTGNKHVSFAHLHPIESEFIHAEGEFEPSDGKGKEAPRNAGIVIGPEHGAVTAFQAVNAIAQAREKGYEDLIFAGFAFDALAQDRIQEANDLAAKLHVHMAMIRPDVLMGDLLKGNKTTGKGAKKKAATEQSTQQLFTVFGQPRTRVESQGEEFVIHMEGMDVYDPVKNEVVDTKAGKVAAWFLDTNYDGKTFCICQAFFPDKDAWTKLAKSLKETNEAELAAVLEKMKGASSLPFVAGDYRRVAVKVIDPRGNEVLRVHQLDGVSE